MDSNANYIFFPRVERTLFFTSCRLLKLRVLLKIAVDNFARQISIIFAIGGWQIGDRVAWARSNDDDSRSTINGGSCGWYSCARIRECCTRKYMVAEYESPAWPRIRDVWVCVSRSRKILPPRSAYGSFCRLISNNVDVPFSQSAAVLTLIRQKCDFILFIVSFKLSYQKSNFSILSTLFYTSITNDINHTQYDV